MTTNQQWIAAITEARLFIKNYDRSRWRVADLAISVCDMSHGGRKKTQFSVARFAKEIGLNKKTLYEWIRAKVVLIDRLPISMQKEALKKKKYNDLREISSRLTVKSSDSDIESAYNEYFSQEQDDLKFKKYHKHLKSLLYNASRPSQMMNVNSEIILDIISTLDRTSDLLKKELEKRKSSTKEQRQHKESMKIKKATAKAIKELGGNSDDEL